MKYFTLQELARSDTAERLGIDNTPPPEVVQNLERLVEHVLDPLREAYGKPICVNSGYRCPALNRAVGGAPMSQHMKGQAADIRPLLTPSDKRRLVALLRPLPFDQLIVYPTFLHISWSTTPRHQVLSHT